MQALSCLIEWCSITIRQRHDIVLSSQAFYPFFHRDVVSVLRFPWLPQIASFAWCKSDKAWEALDLKSISCVKVYGAIDFHEFDLVSILCLELFYDFVPCWHKFDTVMALGHKKVNDHKWVFSFSLHKVLKLLRICSQSSLGFSPPVHVHFLKFGYTVNFKFIYYNNDSQPVILTKKLDSRPLVNC